jgi:hypothetical protein
VIALARAARYGEWRASEWNPPARPDGIDRDAAAALVANLLQAGGGWLEEEAVAQLFSAYGLPLVSQNMTLPGESVQAPAASDGVNSLETTTPSIDTSNDRAARRASGPVRREGNEENTERRPMPPDDVELVIGLVHDRHFGPIVVCGAGGAMADVLNDTSVRLTPLTTQDASAMLRELKIYPILSGSRDGIIRDTDALVDVLLRVGSLAEDLPNVIDVECRPVLVHGDGVTMTAARVRVEHVDPSLPLGARTR